MGIKFEQYEARSEHGICMLYRRCGLRVPSSLSTVDKHFY